MITIEVYDLFGRKIKEVISGFQEEGEHHLTWNGKELPAGIYMIRLQTSEFHSSIKVVKLD
jgi:flagellar hook assembly protein FlgD